MENTKIFVTPRAKLQLELIVYNIANSSIQDYQGGLWHFCKEGNFWFLTDNSHVKVCNDNNYFEGEMTSRATGIAFCMMACSALSMDYFEKNPHLSEFWTDYYHFLREFIFNSENFSEDDRNKISRFLD